MFASNGRAEIGAVHVNIGEVEFARQALEYRVMASRPSASSKRMSRPRIDRRSALDMMGRMLRIMLGLFVVGIGFSGCAVLHHVQLGDVVSHPNYVQKPFDIKISETGININEAKELSKVFLDEEGKKRAESIAALVGLFQMGPRTGNPVYTPRYARGLFDLIYEKCPSGKITGLTSVRETRKYPVISGEIVHITGFCLIPKGAS